MPEIGKIIQCKQERINPKDLYAVSIMKGDSIVEDVPCERSCTVWYFIKHDSVVTCQVTVQQKHGKGLEVSCYIVSLHMLNSKCL